MRELGPVQDSGLKQRLGQELGSGPELRQQYCRKALSKDLRWEERRSARTPRGSCQLASSGRRRRRHRG